MVGESGYRLRLVHNVSQSGTSRFCVGCFVQALRRAYLLGAHCLDVLRLGGGLPLNEKTRLELLLKQAGVLALVWNHFLMLDETIRYPVLRRGRPDQPTRPRAISLWVIELNGLLKLICWF